MQIRQNRLLNNQDCIILPTAGEEDVVCCDHIWFLGSENADADEVGNEEADIWWNKSIYLAQSIELENTGPDSNRHQLD